MPNQSYPIIGITRVRNERAIIADTIRHMEAICDGLIVYDDCSSDDTVDVIRTVSTKLLRLIQGEAWLPDRTAEETRHRALLCEAARQFDPEWLFYFDADERFEGDIRGFLLSDEAHNWDGVRIQLFDAYLSETHQAPYTTGAQLAELERLFGPERRDILMVWRNSPAFSFVGRDKREPVVAHGSRVFYSAFRCKHFGKGISVEQWEETCEYYSNHFPEPYASKWRERRGKAVHTHSDFGRPLYAWECVAEFGVPTHPAAIVSLNTTGGGSAGKRPLKVLIATHHLMDYAGSETYTLTLAKYLSRSGVEITVYGKYIDQLRSDFAALGIPLVYSLELVKDECFDVAHVHHNIVAHEVRAYFPNLPIVFQSHGVLPLLEQPPELDLNISRFLGVSEEVADHLVERGVPESRVAIYRNIVDPDLFYPQSRVNAVPRSALVLSNRNDPAMREVIGAACAQNGMDVQFVGMSTEPVAYSDLAARINAADVVISLGRGVMEAMLCGRVSVVYDYRGGDGLLTPDDVRKCMRRNFSGRTRQLRFSANELSQELSKYRAELGSELQLFAEQWFSPKARTEWLLALYRAVAEEGCRPLDTQRAALLRAMVDTIKQTQSWSRKHTQRDTSKQHAAKAIAPVPSYEDCVRLYEHGEHQAAVVALGRLTEAVPEHALALNDLGVLHLQQGNSALALVCLERAHGYRPSDANIAANLAEAYVAAQRWTEAVTAYQRGLTHAPQDARLLGGVVQLFRLVGDHEQAQIWQAKLPRAGDSPLAQPASEESSDVAPSASLPFTDGMRDAEYFDRFAELCRHRASAGARTDVSIVIPVFNKLEYTQKCLAALFRHTDAAGISYEVIVVNNASSDGTAEYMAAQRSVLTWTNKRNLGFAKGCNQGAMLACGRLIVFLNNDTEVHAGWLEALVHELDSHDKTGAVGGKLLYPDGTIQHAGVAVGRDQVPIHVHRCKAADAPVVNERREFPIVTAACMAVRRSEFLELGLFDELFVNGHEDIDLCLRYRERGMKIIYTPGCVVTHHESVSEGRLDSRPENMARTFYKWRYKLVQDDFTFNVVEAQRVAPKQALRFAIKIGPPDRTHGHWGDIYFAECLAKALYKAGHDAFIHYLNEWGSDDRDIDVVIHLKGLSEYKPKPYNINIMWMLNHPSLHTKEELERYDAVLVASEPHARRLAKTLKVPVRPFLQATDPEHFHPQKRASTQFDIVFVGNNDGVGRLKMRKIVADVLPTDHRLAVWGRGWDNLLPPGVWQGPFVPFEHLPAVYASAKVVLNDHQPEMAQQGFVNNRTYDVIASGAVLVSDVVQGMQHVLPISTYNDKRSLQKLLDDILSANGSHAISAASLRERVRREFSFEQRVDELMGVIAELDQAKSRAQRSGVEAAQWLRDDVPLVSVLMSTHNRREFLPAAIASIQAQTYTNWELLLVNDGGEPVEDIVAAAADARIRMSNVRRSQGKAHALNLGARSARGEFFAYLDDDDIWYPDHLERLMLPLLSMPGIEMVYSDAYDVKLERDESGVFQEAARELRYRHQVTIDTLVGRNDIQGMSVVHRRALFDKVGGMDEQLRVLIDWDLWRRFAVHTYPYHVSRATADHFLRQTTGERGHGHITNIGHENPLKYEQNRRRVLRKALALQPSSLAKQRLDKARIDARARELRLIAEAYATRGDVARARRFLDVALSERPDELELLRSAGGLELAQGNARRAVEHLRRACDKSPTVDIGLSLLEAQVACGHTHHAISEIIPGFYGSWERLNEKGRRRLATLREAALAREYDAWRARQTLAPELGQQILETVLKRCSTPPSFEFLLWCDSGDEDALADIIEALSRQSYPHWHLGVVSHQPMPDPAFGELPVLTWHHVAPSCSKAFAVNQVAAQSRAEWICILEAGERPLPNYLLGVASTVAAREDCAFVYTDEALIDSDGKAIGTRFKPGFNLDLLRSLPYTEHGSWIKRAALRDVGGVEELSDSLMYELSLRVLDALGERAIAHAAGAVMERRVDEKGAPSAFEQPGARAALELHLARNNLAAGISESTYHGGFKVEYVLRGEPSIAVVVRAGQGGASLINTVASVLGRTDYRNVKIAVVLAADSNSMFPALEELASRDARLTIHARSPEVDEACAVNELLRRLEEDYIVLLDGDVAPLQPRWLRSMLQLGQRGDVGLVGARVLTVSKRIHHAGLVLGMGDDGVADFVYRGLPVSEPGYMGRAQLVQNYSAVASSCVLARRALLLELGGLAEGRGGLIADIDLCQRISASGRRIAWTPYATLMCQDSRDARDQAPAAESVSLIGAREGDPAHSQILSLRSRYGALEAALPTDCVFSHVHLPRIVGFPVDDWAHGHYRITSPLMGLADSGRAVVAVLPAHEGGGMPTAAELARADAQTLLLQTPFTDAALGALEDYARLLPEAWRVLEIDDRKEALPTSNPFHSRMLKDIKKRIRRAAALCHRMVVSTEPLKDAYRRYHDDVIVVPNYLEAERWLNLNPVRNTGQRFRVGWAGAAQHHGDLMMMTEVVKETAKDVDWVFLGMCPEALRPYVAEFHEHVSLQDYPAKLASLGLNLAVAPLEHNAFNEAKSNLRLLEYGVLGWPVVCTDIQPYKGAPATRVPNTRQAWISAIQDHMADPGESERHGQRLRAWVLENWLRQQHLEDYLDAFVAGGAELRRQRVT